MNKEKLKALLLQALEGGIGWEEGLIDAGAYSDKAREREAINTVKAFKKIQDFIAPNRPMTLRQYLNSIPDECYLTLDEIKEKTKDQTFGKI